MDERDGETLYRRTAYEYDLNGNMTREQRCGGYWDRDGKQVRTDGADLTLQFTYDKRDRRIRVEDGTGAVISYRYDVQGKPVHEERLVSEDVKQVLDYGYDRAGRLTKVKEELDSGLPELPGEHKYAITIYRYDENGNRTEIITPEGYHILREYDSRDRLCSERVLDKGNGIDRTTEVSYDSAGNITKITRRGKGQEAWELRYDYDLKDRITHVEDCLGPVFQYAYDRNDQLKEEILPQASGNHTYENRNTYTYNAYGQTLSMADGTGTLQREGRYLPDGKMYLMRTADGNETEYSYGTNGMETEVHTARSKKAGLPAQQYTYDSRGRITGLVNGNGNMTGYDMDSWGRVRRVQNAEGGKEGYTHNYAGNITSTKDANGGVITYRYNSQSKVCEIIDQEGHSDTFHYDREGRMTLHTDRNGNQVRASYNVDGNLVVETGTDRNGENAVTRSWEYDTSGRVKEAVSGGFCYTYEYRTDGKLIRKSSSGRTLLSCTYFSNGSLASLTDTSGKPVYYEYDWRGKLSGVKDENGNTLAQYTHTRGGKLKEIRHGNGMYTQYEYDTDGNIIHLRLERPDGTALSDWQYEYDLNGNRTLKAGSFADAEEKLCGTVILYRYDRMDRLTEESHDGEAVGYSYDLCGNRLEKVDKNGKEVYTYNVKNQLASRKSEKAETCYRYDQQGNVLEATGTEGGTYYSYNAFNQQIRVQKSDGSILESLYDAEHMRIGTIENGEQRSFTYFNEELLAEMSPNWEVTERYILGYGVAARWTGEGKGCYFSHLDEQNSIVYITGKEGGIENSYRYDAFGIIYSRQENICNRILYAGQQYDSIIDQYYMRARFYYPVVGRFQQEDVYRGDGLNLYAYCWNNPVVYYNPSGYGYQKEKAKEIPNLSYKDIKEALYARYDQFMEKKEKRGKFKNQGSSLDEDELKSLAWKDEYGTPYEKHHMPAANTLPTSIPYEEGACGNVPPKIHDQTFTNGLNESNRPYDYALYNSLTYEDKLAFDNKNLKDLYAKMKPEADQKEIAKRIDANYEFSMQVKESHPESTEPEGTCPDK